MWFRSVSSRPKPAPSRLAVEVLEDRTVPTFLPVASFPVETSRDNLTVGDFNNDAIPDLIASAEGDLEDRRPENDVR